MPPPPPPPSLSKYDDTAAHREPRNTQYTFDVANVLQVRDGYKFEGILGEDVSKRTRITITRPSDQEDISVLMHYGAGAMLSVYAQGKVDVVKKQHFHGEPHLVVEVKITKSYVGEMISGDRLQIYFTKTSKRQGVENFLQVQFDNFIEWYINQLQSIITKLKEKQALHIARITPTQSQLRIKLR